MSDCRILEDLHGRAYDHCIPLQVTLELTLRCNIRCTHCYNFDRDQPRPASGAELSLEEIRALMDDLRRAGTLFLSLTGGEAMVHPRFWEIADEAAARGFALQVLSNGTLLTEAACDRLASVSASTARGRRRTTRSRKSRDPSSARWRGRDGSWPAGCVSRSNSFS
jgi:MoaA/NifB/PqqE/SkfB family radical SAM enzyme